MTNQTQIIPNPGTKAAPVWKTPTVFRSLFEYDEDLYNVDHKEMHKGSVSVLRLTLKPEHYDKWMDHPSYMSFNNINFTVTELYWNPSSPGGSAAFKRIAQTVYKGSSVHIFRQELVSNRQLHCTNGPAVLELNVLDGTLVEAEFFHKGRKFSREYFVGFEYGTEELEFQFELIGDDLATK